MFSQRLSREDECQKNEKKNPFMYTVVHRKTHTQRRALGDVEIHETTAEAYRSKS